MNATLSAPLPAASPTRLSLARRFAEKHVTRETALPLGLGLGLVAGVGDALTTAEATFTLFYLIPIGLVAWFRGTRAAYVVIAEVLAISGAVNVWLDPRDHSCAVFLVWNLLVELGIYVVFAHLLAALRGRMRHEIELRKGAIDQLRHAERLTTVGKLAAGVAHELGTPMNVISGLGDLIASGRLADEHTRRSGTVIVEQIERMVVIIRGLLDFARRGGTQTKTTELGALSRSTVEMLRPFAHTTRAALVVEGEEVTADVNPGEIQQVLSNLIKNALQATPVGGRVDVRTHVELTRSPQHPEALTQTFAVVSVRDEGTGIAPDVLPLIFDPFFTTKDVGDGTGLGLSVSYGIVSDHGGFIRVETRWGEGTTFFVYLPRSPRRPT
jgi:signal transduction histidine kinase